MPPSTIQKELYYLLDSQHTLLMYLLNFWMPYSHLIMKCRNQYTEAKNYASNGDIQKVLDTLSAQSHHVDNFTRVIPPNAMIRSSCNSVRHQHYEIVKYLTSYMHEHPSPYAKSESKLPVKSDKVIAKEQLASRSTRRLFHKPNSSTPSTSHTQGALRP